MHSPKTLNPKMNTGKHFIAADHLSLALLPLFLNASNYPTMQLRVAYTHNR